jgi:hypothetical protein
VQSRAVDAASTGDDMTLVVPARLQHGQLIGCAAKVNTLTRHGPDVVLGDLSGDERGEKLETRRTAQGRRLGGLAVCLHETNLARVTRNVTRDIACDRTV